MVSMSIVDCENVPCDKIKSASLLSSMESSKSNTPEEVTFFFFRLRPSNPLPKTFLFCFDGLSFGEYLGR